MFELTSDLVAEIPSPKQLELIQSWLDDLAMIDAARPRAPIVKLVAQRRGCSVSSVYQKFYAVEKDGPGVLIDGRSQRKRGVSVYGHRSPAFVQWVHSFYYRVKRENATPTVQGLMLAQLYLWRKDPGNSAYAIPGYQTPPLDSAESKYRHPLGWSQRQLNAIKPDDYKRQLAGQGRHSANELLAPVYTTRQGLHVGEVYMFDDQHLDVLFHYGDKLVRPIGLNVLDLFSGTDITRGIRPFLKDNPDGEKALTERDMIWLTVELLTFEGYYKKRCHLVVEAGTATIREEFRKLLSVVSDGSIKVDVGEVSKEQVAGIRTIARGNPRFKAARESWFDLFRNRMGSLSMQTGLDYKHLPEATARLEQEENALLKLASKLPEHARRDLMLESLPWSRGVMCVNHVAECINQRRDHDLEAWASLGFEFVEYLLDGQWIDEVEMPNLPPASRALISSRMQAGETVSRVTKRSPREVFEAGRGELVKISPFRWHLLVPQKLAISWTIPANRTVKIQRLELGPQPIIFEPDYHNESGEKRALPAGKDVLIFLSPHRPDFALFCDVEARPIGIVFAVQKFNRLEQDQLLLAFSKRNAHKAEIGGSADVYNKQIGEERQARREHNAALLAEHGIGKQKSPKKKAVKPRKKARQENILPAPEESPDATGTTRKNKNDNIL